jgi:hypothetical protein
MVHFSNLTIAILLYYYIVIIAIMLNRNIVQYSSLLTSSFKVADLAKF